MSIQSNATFCRSKLILGSDVAAGGTFTVGYPAGIEGGMFRGAPPKARIAALGGTYKQSSADFSISYGASVATVTWGTGKVTLPAQTEVQVEMHLADTVGVQDASVPPSVVPVTLNRINFGFVDAADADGVCESQSVSSGVAAVLDGVISDVSSGAKAVFDTPRNVVGAWTNSAIMTVTGKDERGNVMVETSASGTSHTGSKAFKEITSVVFNASVTGATVGTGVKLGLPFFLGDASHILQIAVDGAAESVSAAAAGATATPSGTTGDVRGTVTFTTSPNAAKAFTALVIGDPTERGRAQYAG